MTPRSLILLFYIILTIYWFTVVWSNLRAKNRTKPGYRMTGHMAILAGFQTLAFTLMIAGDPKWSELAKLGVAVLTVVPLAVMVMVFAAVRLLDSNDHNLQQDQSPQ